MRHSYGVDPDLSAEALARVRAAVVQLRAERGPLAAERRFAEHDAELQANVVETLRWRADRWRSLSWAARLVGMLAVFLGWLVSGPDAGLGPGLLGAGVVLFVAGVVVGARGAAWRRVLSAVTLSGLTPETERLIRRNLERRARE